MARTGTTAQVLASFARFDDGGPSQTASAPVPGGRRVHYQREADGSVALYSYATVVAIRRPDGTYATTLKRYSVTTSKLMTHLAGALARVGIVATDELVDPFGPGSFFRVWTVAA